MSTHESWGHYPPSRPARVVDFGWPSASLPDDDLLLPWGRGRSYGDVPQNNGHTLLDTARLDRFIAFDHETGLLECEGGTSLQAILQLGVPRGWFLPVTPGTKYVTVGGCIANDVHGKNHHGAGTFGRHVRAFELLRTDGSRTRCTPAENSRLFAATIGGLGLTGLITAATIQLRRIASSQVVVERVPFRSLAEFDELSRQCDGTHDYTVAWFDSFAGRHSRGIFFKGNHASEGEAPRTRPAQVSRSGRRLPVAPFAPLLNPLTVRLFNEAYFRANSRPQPQRVHFEPFFYPLDAVANWNAAYGRAGFLQYQCVIPEIAGLEPVGDILDRAARTRLASFLTVIKKFGPLPSPGLLSFPQAGTTLCLDFAVRDPDVLLPLLEQCDDVVMAAGGSVYPAKDARMTGARFRRFFPQWEKLQSLADPRFSSSFWRRVTA